MNIKYIFSEGRFLLSSLSLKKFSYAISALLSYVFSIISRRPVIWGLPYSCSIEPTNHCNLHCPECPSGMGTLKRKRGEISLEDFKILIDEIKHHTTFLTLYLQGEPLLNRNLAEMIRYAMEERIHTTISTNGQILNESTAKEIVLSGLKKLIVSVDGTDQDSYQRYRRNGSLDKALLGIKNIIKLRKEHGLSHPLVILQFIVFSTNENQLQQIKELGKDLHVDKIEIKTAQHYDLSSYNPLITSLDKYRRYKRGPDGNWVLKKRLRNKCIRLWTTAVFTWDRQLIPCCYDKDATYTFAYNRNEAFEKVWKGEKFMAFRGCILKNKSQFDICSNCGE